MCPVGPAEPGFSWLASFIVPTTEGLAAGAQEQTDEEMIRSLEEQGVDWVLYVNEQLAGVESNFPTLRPRFWEYLHAEFRPVRGVDLPRGHILLERR